MNKVMGKIPSTSNMISAIIVSPGPGDNIAALQTFTMSVQLTGLQAGSFTNAAATYYAAPQDLNAQGQVIGHTHLTVQDLGGSLAPTTAPDPTKFVFFKGINDAGNGNGLLSATVTGGLPAGNYRVCSMTSASNHQPVLMPVAQRGAQDDCQKFTVSASGAASGSGSGGAGTGAAASSSVANTATASSAADTATASSAIAASSSSAAANAGQGGRGGRGGRTRVASASPVASSATSAAVVASGTASATATSASASTTSSAAASTGTAAVSTGTAGALGGITAPPVTNSGDKTRPFLVSGNTFVTAAAAKQRACDIQNNACSNAVNSGTLTGVTLAQCAAQQTACNAA
jgi:transcription initiation factor TFIID subunit 15